MRINSPFEILKRFLQGFVGVIIGFMVAHHFVEIGGGVWPADLSIIGYLLQVWELPGGATVIMLFLSLFSRKEKRKASR